MRHGISLKEAQNAPKIEYTLPVRRMKIAEKLEENRVVFLTGHTGCGKSSQVPQMLLESLGGPILCTQPRRLAVVAIATRVAEERGVELGEEVGYHIGGQRMANSSTRILFMTCGVLLEQIRTQGFRPLPLLYT